MRLDFVSVGKALAAPARAAMVNVLLDGQAHTAGALGAAAGVTSATTSEHLALLVDSGMVTVTKDGRFRRYQIIDHRIASALETLGRPAAVEVTSLRLSLEQRRVQMARTCYDHLAGKLGVALLDMLLRRHWVTPFVDDVTAEGVAGFAALGIHIDHLRSCRRPLLRTCVDWTEQREHLAGGLGATMAAAAFDRRWVERKVGSRGLTLTPLGRDRLSDLGVGS
ncbi:MAG: helix-turn-helix domain-containing protein [Actinomycetota bacterium]|nr:helix-turn-helix domain-containing protein [Actinomycetota bacterium]